MANESKQISLYVNSNLDKPHNYDNNYYYYTMSQKNMQLYFCL